jgi:hypothetical protein
MKSLAYFIGAAGLALGAGVGMISTAQAGAITQTYNFTAYDFHSIVGAAVPVNRVTGSITVTFDPAASGTTDQTSGIKLNSLSIGSAQQIAFRYDPQLDQLQVGGAVGGTRLIFAGTNDFTLVINHPLSNPTLSQFGFTSADIPADGFNALHGSVETPEPASAVLFASALGGFGILRRLLPKHHRPA